MFLLLLKNRLPGCRQIAETLILSLTSLKSLQYLGLSGVNGGQLMTSVIFSFLALTQQGFQAEGLTAHLRADCIISSCNVDDDSFL